MSAVLRANQISACFGERTVIHGLSLSIKGREIISIIGPNGSGKSTLLRILARNLKPRQGTVLLDGKDIKELNGKELARGLAILHQAPHSSGDLTVGDLVAYGRFPHQSWRWPSRVAASSGVEDKTVVEWALEQTGLLPLALRPLNTLSGGERQRAWIAMALAQKPRILLLDEPTTYLDLYHQLEVLDLLARLNQEQNIAVIMALHDINYAARYSDTVAVLSQGSLYASGRPAEVITGEMLRAVFGVEADFWLDPNGRPVCLAKGIAASAETDRKSGHQND